MKKTVPYVILIIVFLLLPSMGQAKESTTSAQGYQIGPSDLLEIKVFELPDLNQTVRVSADGSITLPLLQKVQAKGLTKDQLETKIAGLLESGYVKDAQVSIFIKEYQSQKVSIIGAVANPGMYELAGQKNLLQMLSEAGGLTENAMNKVYVMRKKEDGSSETFLIKIDDLLNNGNQSLNISILSNDIINIPVDQKLRIFVFGEVKNPGALEIKKSEEITLLKAIAQAGGLTVDAKKKGVIIKRKSSRGREYKINVNLMNIIRGRSADITLIEGDVIFVPQSVW
jgi:polysaccharide export outer membrane protein